MKEQQDKCKQALKSQDYRKFLQFFKTSPCSQIYHSPLYCSHFHLQTSFENIQPSSSNNSCQQQFYFVSLDRRRNPYGKLNQILYYPQLCQNIGSGCQNQECLYCHNSWQYNYHPLIFKTANCEHFYDCKYQFCFRIHYQQITINSKNQTTVFRFSQFFRFDIMTFKSVQCKKQYPHDKNSCLCYHNSIDSRRPNFATYDHMQCKKMNEGGCFDSNCQFSHNKIQQLYHPSRYKSKFCEKHQISRKNANNQQNFKSSCPYGKYCSFAHDQSQISVELIDKLQKNLQFHLYAYKTVWCPYTIQHNRSICVYAHNIQDFRRNPKQYHYEPIQCPYWKKNQNIKCIQDAGCPNGMNCNKCHGWKQKQFHPIIYCKNKQNQSSYKNKSESLTSSEGQKQKVQSPYVHKKKNSQTILKKKLGAEFAAKTNLQTIVHKFYIKNDPTKQLFAPGAPFFQNSNNEKIKSRSQKGDATKQQTNQKMLGVQQKGACIMTSKSIAIKGTQNQSCGHDFQQFDDRFLFKAFQSGNQNTCDQKGSGINRTEKNQSQSGKQHKIIEKAPRTVSKSLGCNIRQTSKNFYSKDVCQLLNPQIISVLKGKNINQIKLINMNEQQIRKIQQLTSSQKSLIIKKIIIARDNARKTPIYEGVLQKYFIKYGKRDILVKMRNKKVKQQRLLLLDSEIKQLSFLSQSQKRILPKIIAEFKNNIQFEQLNNDITKSIISQDYQERY